MTANRQSSHVSHAPQRKHLPEERASVTSKFSIAGHEGYLIVSMFPDGTPGEIFIKMAKQGSTMSGLVDGFAIMVSIALQYGVPLGVLVEKFEGMRFEPQGFTSNKAITPVTSIYDYVFRYLASKFLDGPAETPYVERDAEPKHILSVLWRGPSVLVVNESLPALPSGPDVYAAVVVRLGAALPDQLLINWIRDFKQARSDRVPPCLFLAVLPQQGVSSTLPPIARYVDELINLPAGMPDDAPDIELAALAEPYLETWQKGFK